MTSKFDSLMSGVLSIQDATQETGLHGPTLSRIRKGWQWPNASELRALSSWSGLKPKQILDRIGDQLRLRRHDLERITTNTERSEA